MKVFISGASGLVGGNCLTYFKSKEKISAVGSYFSFPTSETTYFNTLDANDPENFDVASFKPDVIIHCGALTHVDYCELHPEESELKTVESTKNLIALCKKLNARLVYISTDYVFDGIEGPYEESAVPNPVNVYGKHKLQAEQLVQEALKDRSLIIRITNVYGDEERGKNFIARMLSNVLGKEVVKFSLPIDQYATPANAMDIAKALYLLITDHKSGIYHLGSTDFVNRFQLAKLVMKYVPDHQVFINPVSTKAMEQAARRPLMGGLLSGKFLNEYPEFTFTNVDDYIQKKLNIPSQSVS